MLGRKVALGRQAPDFKLQAAGKETVSLIDLRGKTLLLTFLQSSG
jgi:peroxiredoxin